MEHRYSARVDTNVNVIIYRSGIPVAFGRVVNGCKIGFFIETNFSDINIYQMLDIEFISSSTEEDFCKYVFNVHVTRKTDQGFGVEIESIKLKENNAFNSLINKLNFLENIPSNNHSQINGY